MELRLARDSDADAIAGWTRAPEVLEFWGGRPVELDEVLAKYTGRRAPDVVSYVILAEGRRVGYTQAWHRAGRYGIDMFIAADAQGRGIGSRAARALAYELITAGWTPLTVDPAVTNTRAIRLGGRQGFARRARSKASVRRLLS